MFKINSEDTSSRVFFVNFCESLSSVSIDNFGRVFIRRGIGKLLFAVGLVSCGWSGVFFVHFERIKRLGIR